ncbi:hypothetical protein O6B72_07455 [Campylobacter ureolyticus]|uniref:hypothetical protein n=1 Tax=Campylobacter ureolyticus TaxID=827 RepID=UPI0022B52680|nr:hypothetical protein [Campylobacter ureolyticus]MCZ6156642.1 hypothetical protein [Campylobacter ureolyticus]
MKNENLKINDLKKEYEEYELSDADKADLKEILAQRERGKLEYVTMDEILVSTEATIKQWENKQNKK